MIPLRGAEAAEYPHAKEPVKLLDDIMFRIFTTTPKVVRRPPDVKQSKASLVEKLPVPIKMKVGEAIASDIVRQLTLDLPHHAYVLSCVSSTVE